VRGKGIGLFYLHEMYCRPYDLLFIDINKSQRGDWKLAMEEQKNRYLILVGHKK
jgi:hypothetical protein